MATASRCVCRSFRSLYKIAPAKRKCITPLLQPQQHRYASTSDPKSSEKTIPFMNEMQNLVKSARLREDADNPAELQPEEYLTPEVSLQASDLDNQERADYDALPAEQQKQYLAELNHWKAMSEQVPKMSDVQYWGEDGQDFPDANLEEEIGRDDMRHIESLLKREMDFDMRIPKATSARNGMGWWADDEDDEMGQYPDMDDEWDENIISSIAENELQLHREIRQYTRVAAWEMPLLTKYAKPLQAPTHATPLRFRYTTYMGETHPAARKVVVEFTTADLATSTSLSELQRVKLQKLLGPRYNHVNDQARISSEKFPNAAQNKRYLGDLVASLVTAAKDSSDTFEDIPLDVRHTKIKKKHVFPEGWLMTEGRVAELKEMRESKRGGGSAGEQKVRTDEEVEAQRKIEDYMMKMQLGRREGPSLSRRGGGGEEAEQRVPEAEEERVPVPVRPR